MPNPENVVGKGFEAHPERINRNGRPRKIYSVLKETGYTRDDVREAFNEISWASVDDLKRYFENPNAPAIVRVIAHAFKRAIEKGDYRYVREILEQSIGKPKETVDLSLHIEQPMFPDETTKPKE